MQVDSVVLESNGLELDESLLTGEADSVEKEVDAYDRANPHFELACSECHGPENPGPSTRMEVGRRDALLAWDVVWHDRPRRSSASRGGGLRRPPT